MVVTKRLNTATVYMDERFEGSGDDVVKNKKGRQRRGQFTHHGRARCKTEVKMRLSRGPAGRSPSKRLLARQPVRLKVTVVSI